MKIWIEKLCLTLRIQSKPLRLLSFVYSSFEPPFAVVLVSQLECVHVLRLVSSKLQLLFCYLLEACCETLTDFPSPVFINDYYSIGLGLAMTAVVNEVENHKPTPSSLHSASFPLHQSQTDITADYAPSISTTYRTFTITVSYDLFAGSG